MSPLERDQIPDSIRWARFRGVGWLRRGRSSPGIASVWLVLILKRLTS